MAQVAEGPPQYRQEITPKATAAAGRSFCPPFFYLKALKIFDNQLNYGSIYSLRLHRDSKGINLAVLGVIASGFVLRFWTATGTWLNPDEALNYLIANQSRLAAVYQASLTNPHPPLYFFILHLWRALGTSEIMLRLLSIVLSSSAVWFFYRWLALTINPASGLAGAVLFSFLPALVENGIEVRSYGLLLLLVSISLYLTENGIQKNRMSHILFAVLFSALAGTAHYSTLWFSVSLGIYWLIGGATGRMKPRLFFAGLGAQAGVALVYLLLYLTHLKDIRHSAMTQFAITGWLKGNYLQPGENLFTFVGRNTVGLFRYLTGSSVLGYGLLGFFISGVLFIMIRRRSRDMSLIILMPFIFNIIGAWLKIMPFGGTRHSILLGVFICAGVAGLNLAIKPKYRLTGAGIAGLMVLLSNLFLSSPRQHIPRPQADRQQMSKAIKYLKAKAPGGDTIFTDYQGSALLSYYLANPRRPVQFFGRARGDFQEFDYGGYLVVSTKDWDFNQYRSRFGALIDKLYQHYGWNSQRILWVFDGGWGMPLMLREQEFGRNISVFAVAPELLLTPAKAESLLMEAIEEVKKLDIGAIRTFLFPTRFLSSRVKDLCLPWGREPISYAELYQGARTGKADFDARLPALAFWLFNYYEPHPEFMNYMADGESYIAGEYRFTLLLMDYNREIAVYRLEPK